MSLRGIAGAPAPRRDTGRLSGRIKRGGSNHPRRYEIIINPVHYLNGTITYFTILPCCSSNRPIRGSSAARAASSGTGYPYRQRPAGAAGETHRMGGVMAVAPERR